MPIPAGGTDALATLADLEAFLQTDINATSGQLALDSASALFVAEAGGVAFASAVGTYTTPSIGDKHVFLGGPVTAVSEVRINGVAVVDYTRIGDVLYRAARFGSASAFPPDVIEVDYTTGYTSVPDDVKLAVLQLAGELYDNPRGAASKAEQIDDYSIAEKYADVSDDTPVAPGWREIAAKYRGLVVA